MREGDRLTRAKYGRSVRVTHAKAYDLRKGELQVLGNLPEPFQQGIFATGRSYQVIVRLSHVSGELLDDRKVSMPRGMALKVLGVDGPKLPGHEGEGTQDFVLDTGRVFNTPDARAFLAQIAPIETVAPRLPEAVKQVVSTVSRTANAALNTVGVNSPNLDFLGHSFVHPFSEPFYSQAAIRYGENIAKLRVAPVTPLLTGLAGQPFEPQDEDGLRTATVDYFGSHGAIFEVAVQLCTDLERKPVENAHTEWPEDESPTSQSPA